MTQAAKSPLAHESAIATAKVLVLTACDLLANPAVLEAARADFAERSTPQVGASRSLDTGSGVAL
jgi:hypothetical protein